MRDILFSAIWAVLLPLNLMSAPVGVLLWTWVALLSPNELLYGFMGSVPYNKIVAIITLVLVFFTKDKKDPYLDKVFVLLILFTVVTTISWLNAIVSDPGGDELY